MARAREEAGRRAIEAGADLATLEVVDREDIAMAYLPGNRLRVRPRVVAELV